MNESTSNCDESTSNCEEEEISGLRIRNVDEINLESNNIINSSSDIRKRKLPSWLTGSGTSTNTSESTEQKRSKPDIDEHNQNHTEEITSNGVIEDSNVVNSNEITSNANNSVDSVDETGNNNIEKPESNAQVSDSDSDEEVKLPSPIIKKEIKEENGLDDNCPEANSSTPVQTNNDTKPIPAAAIKEEATSSSDRESCRYGIRCYRRNLLHRQEQAHPGDTDYKRPDYPTPPLGTPDCPYGDQCYRRNPAHFRDFAHPPSTDFQKNWDNHKRKLRQRKKKNYNINNSSDSDSSNSLKDFIVDSDESEFVPDEDTEELL